MKKSILIVVFLMLQFIVFGQQVLNTKKNLTEETLSTFEQVSNPIEFAKKESIKGLMDFNEILKDEKGVLFVYDKVAYNKEQFAILLWAKAAKKINIDSYKTAKKIWEEIYNKKLTKHELKAFKKGYK